ncbi:M48 family metallopeptidase [Nevskia ramosa]|uniref:M48 family metallopeptidase n=1 Tax=Nevskia ramosa TaxID=64002 RepID=UPI002356D3FC|nr:M48 family metallopeptidase [Nevskia ramosa]
MSQSFAALLYGRDLPPAGLKVSAQFVGNRLQVGGDLRLEAAADAITIETGGFDHDTLYLGWTDATRGRLSLAPLDTVARATLIASAPAMLETALRRHVRSSRNDRGKWLLLGGLAASLAVLVLGVVLGYGLIVDWAVRMVPPEVEEKLGKSTMAELRQSGKLLENGPAVEAVSSIGNKLTAGSRYHYHWAVLEDPSINAFAAPGGCVVVHRGLILAAKTPEELAGVLAHEVQHVENRHTLKAMVNGLGWATMATVLLGDVSAMAGMLAYQVGTTHYSRDLETEADTQGLAALARADIAPEGMATFFRTLAKEAPQMPIALLSSHPATEERIAAIEAGIQALPKKDYPPLAIDWPAVKASLEADDKAP